MKKYIKYLLLIVFLISTGNSYAQWQKMFERLTTIYEFSGNSTYVFCATGPAGIFRSSDNGLSWDTVNMGLTNKSVNSITAQGNYIFAGTDSGLFRSTNNGNSWSSIHNNIYRKTVYHLDCNTQYIFAGTVVGIFRSSNLGVTWDSINNGLPRNIIGQPEEIKDISNNNGRIIIGMGAINGIPKIYESTNNGSNWLPIIYNGMDSIVVYSLEIKDSVILCGSHKGVYISRNYGNSWRRIPEINPNIGLFGLSIIDERNIFIASYGYGVHISTNGGYNWVYKNEGLYPGEYNSCALYSIGNYTFLGTRPFDTYLPAIFRRSTQQLIPVIEQSSEIPSSYSLSQNFPNPFNPSTKIKFDVASTPLIPRQRGTFSKLIVYDVMGREVQTLVNESLKPGTYEVTFDGTALTSGVYFYKLQCGDFVQTNRMVLIK